MTMFEKSDEDRQPISVSERIVSFQSADMAPISIWMFCSVLLNGLKICQPINIYDCCWFLFFAALLPLLMFFSEGSFE